MVASPGYRGSVYLPKYKKEIYRAFPDFVKTSIKRLRGLGPENTLETEDLTETEVVSPDAHSRRYEQYEPPTDSELEQLILERLRPSGLNP